MSPKDIITFEPGLTGTNMLSQFFDLLIIIVVSGIIAILLGYLLFRGNPRKQKISQIAIFILSMGFFNGIILPSYQSPEIASHSSEKPWNKLPLMQVIKKHNPELHQQWANTAEQAGLESASDETINLFLYKKLETQFKQRITGTSNKALLEFVEALLSGIDELHQQPGDICYHFLYPEEEKSNFEASRQLSQKVLERYIAAMIHVIADFNSTQETGSIKDSKDLAFELENIFTELQNEYGSELDGLRNPRISQVPKTQICTMTHAFFQKIIEQDKPKAAGILRLLFSSNQAPLTDSNKMQLDNSIRFSNTKTCKLKTKA